MYQHTVTFDSLVAKHTAKEWLADYIDTVETDECLTEKRLVFTTDLALNRREVKMLKRDIQPTKYTVIEL